MKRDELIGRVAGLIQRSMRLTKQLKAQEARCEITHKVQFNKIYPNTDPDNLFAFLDYVQDKHHG